MTATEQSVLDRLAVRVGRARAISAVVLGEQLGLSPREVGAAIKILIEDHGALIGSVTDDPAGYYVIATEEELEQTTRQLWSRAISCLVRISKLERTAMEEIFRQLPLKRQRADEESAADA